MADVTLNLTAFEALAEKVSERGLKTALLAGERVLRADLLSRQGSGRIYKRGRKTHQASAPGEPPAPDTGSLRARTHADQSIVQEGGDLVGRIVANTTYAHGLEVGTERVAARPYLSRLRRDHANDLRAAFIAGSSKG